MLPRSPVPALGRGELRPKAGSDVRPKAEFED